MPAAGMPMIDSAIQSPTRHDRAEHRADQQVAAGALREQAQRDRQVRPLGADQGDPAAEAAGLDRHEDQRREQQHERARGVGQPGEQPGRDTRRAGCSRSARPGPTADRRRCPASLRSLTTAVDQFLGRSGVVGQQRGHLRDRRAPAARRTPSSTDQTRMSSTVVASQPGHPLPAQPAAAPASARRPRPGRGTPGRPARRSRAGPRRRSWRWPRRRAGAATAAARRPAGCPAPTTSPTRRCPGAGRRSPVREPARPSAAGCGRASGRGPVCPAPGTSGRTAMRTPSPMLARPTPVRSVACAASDRFSPLSRGRPAVRS